MEPYINGISQVCLHTKSTCWNPNPQCYGFRRGFGEVIRSWKGFVPLYETPERSLVLSPPCDGTGTSHPSTVRKRTLPRTMLAPWSWTSSVQNCEKYISVVYKPPNLWCSELRQAHMYIEWLPSSPHHRAFEICPYYCGYQSFIPFCY